MDGWMDAASYLRQVAEIDFHDLRLRGIQEGKAQVQQQRRHSGERRRRAELKRPDRLIAGVICDRRRLVIPVQERRKPVEHGLSTCRDDHTAVHSPGDSLPTHASTSESRHQRERDDDDT
jgi:hypothetical protein